MSEHTPRPHHIACSNDFKKRAERIAALLDLNSWHDAIGTSVDIALLVAEAYVKGDTEIITCTPEEAELLRNNPEFFKALCEEGVVEWLTPFVLTKSKRPTPDANQP